MKTLSFTLFLLFYSFSHAQIGVVLIDEEDDSPLGQWFAIRGEENENVVCYYNDLINVSAKLDLFLKDYGLKMKDGQLDDDGNLQWGLDNDNGYFVTLTLVNEEDMGMLIVYTYPANEVE